MHKPSSSNRTTCPRCGNRKCWNLTYLSRRRCARCKYTFVSRFDRISVWRKAARPLLEDFLLEQNTNHLLERYPELSEYQILQTLQKARMAMTFDIPEQFKGTVEVDETYMGGTWQNKRKGVKRKEPKSKRGRGTTKQAVFGILCRNGQVWAELIADIGKKDLQPIILKKVRRGSTVCSDTFKSYTGIATKGYVHRMVDHSKEEYSDGKGNHINGLEGFWGYLKRNLVGRGGIRKRRLKWFLGEYVWKYNHRKLTLQTRTKLLMSLIESLSKSVTY